MLGQIEVIDGPDKGRTFPLNEGETLQIGRGPATATRLCDPCVSRLHCRIEVTGGRLILSDAGSAAGTLVNGTKVERQELLSGDLIAIGNTRLRVQLAGLHEESTVVFSSSPLATPTPKATAALPLEATTLTGSTLGHYELGPILARGGSGIVYQGRNSTDGSAVAVKVLRPELAESAEDVQRFGRAMKTVLPLRHPNLVAVLDWGQTGPFCWCAMELIEGESLQQVIRRIGTAGILDWRYALRVAIHVARALDFAHGHGIVHRNITPSNIFVRAADRVTKLGNLTLARALEGGQGDQVTRHGTLVGDLAYMAPERTYGDGPIDARSDLYGLGATVYALLTGRPPCAAKLPSETIQKIRDELPPGPRTVQLSVPEAFEAVVMRLLAKRPEERFPSAAALLPELEKVARGHGLPVP